MKTIHSSWALLIALITVVATSSAAHEEFYQKHLQPGVSLGMSPDELITARSGALENEFGATGSDLAGTLEMSELRREQNSASGSVYRFKAGKLGAVLGSTKTTKLPVEHTQDAAIKLAQELKTNFALQREDQIVRSVGTVAAVLTAQLWEDEARGLHLYFVATNHEITLVIFDPKAFGKPDFFNGPELLKKVEANNESIRRALGERATPPMPIIDFLAKVKAGSPAQVTTNEQPLTPTAPTPVPTATPNTSSAPSNPVAQASLSVVERKSLVWPWVVGILALVVIVALALKRRA